MVSGCLDWRSRQYFQLSSRLAQLNSAQLQQWLAGGALEGPSGGWGCHQRLALGETQVFVKRLPIAALEYDNLFSTQNLYGLPTYCSYGLGSTGLNVFRELLTHLKTTDWVLEGEIAAFPLLYHYRILPLASAPSAIAPAQLATYIASWGGSQAAGRYLAERASARHELVLMLEPLPQVLEDWLRSHPHQLQPALDRLLAALDFLRVRGMVHFDAHLRNVLTDGEQIYLSDFGLMLDRSFSLSPAEICFLQQHVGYDYGEVLRNLGHLIRPLYEACSPATQQQIRARYAIDPALPPYAQGLALLAQIEQIQADGSLPLSPVYVANIVKYRPIIGLMQQFFADMWSNPHKDTVFPETALNQLLQAVGLLPAPAP